MMPVILTCVVGKQLCEDPSENHWYLRDKSALLLRKICSNYRTSYGTIKPRVIKTLLRAFLDPSKPLTTHYGAVVGLAALGHETLKLMVLPHIKSYGEMLDPIMKSQDQIASNEANRIYQALLVRLLNFIEFEKIFVYAS
jgi:transcription initiation factor TFIID subunit 6